MKKELLLLMAGLLCGSALWGQSFNIGSTYQGGIIFYLEPGGAWGLAAAPNDLPTTYWPQAKQACEDLVLGKKGDWRLPTIEELRLLYDQRAVVGGFNTGNLEYWTSTEVTLFGLPNYALTKSFEYGFGGAEYTRAKVLESLSVRPIRRFFIPLTGEGVESACLPVTTGSAFVPGPARVTYGTGIDISNTTRRMNISIGDIAVGESRAGANNMGFGSQSGFLLAPFAPIVSASQGELLDRIQISWEPNPLGPLPTEGYKLYRDGIFLGAFDNKVRNFNDFNVIAGRPYKYEVLGSNVYGDGALGSALGFQVPNGVVTGYIQTSNHTPVVDAMVSLTPMQGFSVLLGPNDLAFAKDTAGFLNNAANWTLTAWIQTDAALAGSKIIGFEGANWALLPIESASMQEGVVLDVPGQASLSIPFPDSTKHGWHHIAISYDGSQLRAYLDGALAGIVMAVVVSGDTKLLNIAGEGSKWTGRMDELRIYHKRLDELDLGEVMEGTASSLTPGLKYYWKMDEELGTKSFDLIGRNTLYFCGPVFDKNRPPVHTSGKTDANGYYRIESANYGTGTTFIATPEKYFYMHRALKFVRAEENYAVLPDFGLTDSTNLQTATLEIWANSAGPDGTQGLLWKKWGVNEFSLSLSPNGNNNDLKCTINGAERTFGSFGMGYQHIALTFQQTGSNLTVKAYKNGAPLGSPASFSGLSGNWSDTSQTWLVGARQSGGLRTDFFGGLIDELAVYDTILPLAGIQAHATAARDPQERHLRAYFAFDEGAGNQLSNAGAKLTGSGTAYGTDWSAFCAIQQKEPHVFSPATRQVTLNPSVTSVDIVDFVDLSTVPVTGYVRYANSDCFAQNIEILVNGESYSPSIFTDSTGRFVIDLEPGATVRLSPKFEDHSFIPAFWDITNISTPIAGILFNDMTTRKVSGVVAGGHCKNSIIPPGVICKVKIRSVDGCYEKTQQVTDPDGYYEFTDIPPQEMIVAIVEHSDPAIKTAFQVQGGATVDLSARDTVLDFIYYAPPVIEIASGFEPTPPCTQVVFDQGDQVSLQIRLAEDYYGELCYVDSAAFRILNGLSGSLLDTAMQYSVLEYKFRVGLPNPTPPFLQTIQIIATTLTGDEVSLTRQAVVTGLFPKENVFTTLMPETPMLVLRDPPGDGSYAYWEKDQTTCTSTSYYLETDNGVTDAVHLYLGPDFEIAIAPFGVGENSPVDIIFDFDFSGETSMQIINDTTLQTCLTFHERVATSDDQLVVGGEQGGDVFVGGGMNLVFGIADRVQVNSNCEPSVAPELIIQPDRFKTMFVYTEFDIRDNMMRYLDSLANDPNATPAQKNDYLASKANWQKMLDDNVQQKNNAKLLRNISFSAGTEYEYSQTADTLQVISQDSANTSNFTFTFNGGFTINGLGIEFSRIVAKTKVKGAASETGTENAVTTGYVLKDDDPGDLFSVDVAMDEVYKTPVFRTKTGQSSCPWEPGTAHREGVKLSLRDGSGAVATDVPANEPAVFKFTLGNTSASNQTFTYAFTAGPESNPDGAVIKLNGAVLDHPVYYAIPYGESVPITLTVERGPEAFDYDSLEIVLYSECEDARANALGIAPEDDSITYSAIFIGAHFIKPCSEVEINVPEQDWVLHPDPDTPGPDDDFNITLSGYDRNDPDLDVIRVQYRPSVGDGAWINIGPDIPKAALGPIFYQHIWPTAGLPDGPYEIRAVAVCTGDASTNPGYSHVIKGRIEREPPQIVGIPEPSDGVLNVGDEISVTFNKELDCSKIFKADLTNPRNVGLYDATTGALIDFNLYCFENKIELDPAFQNKYFENHILRLDLHNIPDKIGNKLPLATWEFYVDRNELAWLTDSIGMTKNADEIKTATASIHNRGGAPVPFTITGAPAWVRVVPDKGTLVPNEIRPISFEVDSSLAFGMWNDSVTLHTETGINPFFMGGDEKIPIGVRVVCRPPDWNLDAGIHPVTMNLVVELNIQGVPSSDGEDIVAAFINGELRGRAKVQYYASVNKYLAHLTIYGESAEADSTIELQIWDASACLRYASVTEAFTFQPDNVIGTPVNPVLLHTNSLVQRNIPLNNGWNWISFNLAFPDPALNPALASLHYPENDLIKNQSSFSLYNNGGGWVGSLNNLTNTTMYQYRADQPDTLKMVGNVIVPAAVNIPLISGWNWLGYLPNYALDVNDALSSLNLSTGDLIKSQFGFSQYIVPYGWIGNLKYLVAPQGYQLRLTTPGTLLYPLLNPLAPESVESRNGTTQLNYWNIDPGKFEYSMTLLGMLASDNGQNITRDDYELGVFAGTDLRGSIQALYVEPLQAHLFFLTIYSNLPGELLTCKLYNATSYEVYDLSEKLFFTPDLHQGSFEAPLAFTLQTSRTKELHGIPYFDVQPNPLSGSAQIRFSLLQAGEVTCTVRNLEGRVGQTLHFAANAGLNRYDWQPSLPAGVYVVQLQTEEGISVRKVVIE